MMQRGTGGAFLMRPGKAIRKLVTTVQMKKMKTLSKTVFIGFSLILSVRTENYFGIQQDSNWDHRKRREGR